MLYDDRYHLHVGYYENGFDLEAIALKRKSHEVWDFFFDVEQYGLSHLVQDREFYLDGFGIRILSIEIKELDYSVGAKKFEEWLFKQGMI
ncbi:DUF3986 family protein [Bacillus pinisoli]|uniref:DUF3986 family protein n=1 Tax=Bacillus pinisoli TaxID=2901866 RepID=UPI001FF58C32|nr:DUF3986 family protein [Bacillus pinisoli]